MKDYYALLGLKQSATKAEVKKNYRLLATKYHPDKNKEQGSAEKFIAITEAYEVLNNKKRRTQYDLFRWEKLKRQAKEEEYITVAHPRESTRSRRNKAQKKRATQYQQQQSAAARELSLTKESLYIIAHYYLHILGSTLVIAIIHSILLQLRETFDKGIVGGVFNLLIVGSLCYVLFLIISNAVEEFKKDLAGFSIYYKLAYNKVFYRTATALAVILFLYISWFIHVF